jgi:hypothetical protein
VEEAIDAVACIPEIDRGECRRHVEHQFTVDRMIQDYLQVYETIIGAYNPPNDLERSEPDERLR